MSMPSGPPSCQVLPPSSEILTAYHKIHAGDFKQLLDALSAIPDTEGTLLDNTIVVWANELCTGEHSMNQWPVVPGTGRRARSGGRRRRRPSARRRAALTGSMFTPATVCTSV